jgi:hypothetical protein
MSAEGEVNHKWHWWVELRTVITSGKWRDAKEEPIRDFQREDLETSSRNFQWVTKNDGLNIVEGSAPSKVEKEPAHGVRARDVGAEATPGVMVHGGKVKNEANLW